MRLTRRQQEEIDFLQQWFGLMSNTNEIESYINATVNGMSEGSTDKLANSRLRNAKQRWSLMLSLWSDDIKQGLLFPFELTSDPTFNHSYALRCIKRMVDQTVRSKLKQNN